MGKTFVDLAVSNYLNHERFPAKIYLTIELVDRQQSLTMNSFDKLNCKHFPHQNLSSLAVRLVHLYITTLYTIIHTTH